MSFTRSVMSDWVWGISDRATKVLRWFLALPSLVPAVEVLCSNEARPHHGDGP